MPVSDTPMAYKEFAAIKSQVLTELQLTPSEWLRVLGQNMDSTGNPQNLLSTAGAVTEASAATIATYTTYNVWGDVVGDGLYAQGPSSYNAGSAAKYRHMLKYVPFTCDGAGVIADNVILAAGGATYKGCCKVVGMIGSATDATVTIDFEDEDNTKLTGAPVAAAGFTVSLTADTVNTQLNNIFLKGTVANKAIEFDIAGYAAAATGGVWFETWYEE